MYKMDYYCSDGFCGAGDCKRCYPWREDYDDEEDEEELSEPEEEETTSEDQGKKEAE